MRRGATPEKSANDRRLYRSVTLPNGLKALLVTEPPGGGGDGPEADDAAEKPAAVALAVRVGSFADPPALPGLAHFCEHMLFMGTEKYPDESEWEAFVSANGGFSNAFTDHEQTVYYYEITPSKLAESLDRFAQFFVAPLFKEDATSRELRAVDSEFAGVKMNDGVRRAEVMCRTSRPGHPAAKFSWGNVRSLETDPAQRGVGVLDALRGFHDTFYSADVMRLVVLGGSLPLDRLEEDAARLFSAVPRRARPLPERYAEFCARPGMGPPLPLRAGPPHPDYSPCGLPYDEGALARYTCVVPVKDVKYVDVTWALPPQDRHWRSKPQWYVETAVGHEGAGSLHALLKRRGWLHSLEAGVEDSGQGRNSACWLFSVSMRLTDEGFARRDDVLALLFQYLRMLRGAGVQRWLWDETREIADFSFRFLEKSDPTDYVADLAVNMHRHGDAEVISGEQLAWEYDEAAVAGLLDLLTPDGCRIDLVSREFSAAAAEPDAVRRDPWFGTAYTSRAVGADTLARWASEPVSPELSLPPPNEFIPRDFSLRCDDGLSEAGVAAAAAASPPSAAEPLEPPRVVYDTPLGRCWHKTDRTFRVPRANTYFLFMTPHASDSPARALASDVYVRLLLESLNEFTYQATLAGLGFHFSALRCGVELQISGFSDRLPALAARLFDRMARLEVDETPEARERFAATREKSLKGWTDSYFEPAKHARFVQTLASQPRRWTIEAMTECARELTPARVREFRDRLVERCYLEALVHGNLTADDARALVAAAHAAIGWAPLPHSCRPGDRMVRLPRGAPVVVRRPVRNRREGNSAVKYALQLGPGFVRHDWCASPAAPAPSPAEYASVVAPSPGVACREAESMEAARDPSRPPTATMMGVLLSHVMQEPLFDQLRTKEQLGYHVGCRFRCRSGVALFEVVVQSPAHDAPSVEARIERYMVQFRAFLAAMPADEFARYVAGLVTEKRFPLNNLSAETDILWVEVLDRTHVFHRVAYEVADLRKVTKAALLAFFDALVLPVAVPPGADAAAALADPDAALAALSPNPNRARMVVHVNGNARARRRAAEKQTRKGGGGGGSGGEESGSEEDESGSGSDDEGESGSEEDGSGSEEDEEDDELSGNEDEDEGPFVYRVRSAREPVVLSTLEEITAFVERSELYPQFMA